MASELELTEEELLIVKINRIIKKINVTTGEAKTIKITAEFKQCYSGYSVSVCAFNIYTNQRDGIMYKPYISTLDELNEAYLKLKGLAEMKGLI